MKQRRYPAAKLGPVLIVGTFALLWLLERKRPLRKTVEPPQTRQVRNLIVAAIAAATVQLVEMPLVEPLARMVERKRYGLIPRIRGPEWLRTTAALLLLDYW